MGNSRKKAVTIFIVLTALVVGLFSFKLLGNSFSDDSLQAPKVLKISTSSGVVFDPLQAKNSQEFFTVSLTSSTLLNLDKKNGVTNGLANTYTLSQDALSVTLSLKGAKFSDGSPVTSKDVKVTLSRLVDTENSYRTLLSNVKGYGEAKTGKDFFGISDKDEDKVVIDLISPDPYFLFKLTHPGTSILSADSISKDGTINSYISSGKYSVTKINDEVGKTTVYTPLEKDQPVVKVEKRSSVESKAINSDILLGVNESNSYNRTSVPQLALATWNIYVGNGASPLADVRLRKAILLAIDTEETIAPYGSRAVEPSDFGGGMFDSTNCSKNCESDVKESKKLIKELYPDDKTPTINIDIENNDIQKELAASAANDLSKVGISTIVREHSASELSNLIARGEVGLYRFGWISNVAIMGDGIVAGFKADSANNISGIVDIKLEKKIKEYEKAKTVEEKKEVSIALQERLKDLWVVRPIAVFQDVISTNKAIIEVDVDFYGRIDIGKIRIEKE